MGDKVTKIFDPCEIYHSIIEQLPLALYSKDAETLRFALWNRTSETWWGLKKEDVLGKSDFDFFPAAQARSNVERDREILARGEMVEIAEETIETRKGKRILHSKLIPVRDAQGRPLCLLSISDDITEKKLTREKLEEAQERLIQSQKLDSIGRLAGGIAHDFNNLLAVILGHASALREELSGDDRVVRKLAAMIKSATRGSDLTRKLLGFARQGQYQKSRIEVLPLIQELTDVLFRSLDKSITIKTISTQGVWPIEGDSSQIFQVLMNLSVNAADAMPSGGDITFEARNFHTEHDTLFGIPELKPGRYVRLSVKDVGVGIPDEIRNRIFDPFFTTKELGKGTGLGLSMVYGIMRNHRGLVTVTSRVGEGTEFQLYFPAMEESVPEVGKGTETRQVQAARPGISGTGILIADDEPLLRELTRDILEPFGARLFFAEDGQKAVEIYRAHQHEIETVLLDVGMPKMNGIKAYFELKKMNPAVHVIFVTGYAENAEIIELRKTDGVAFVEKPFDPNVLIQKIAARERLGSG